MESFKTFRHEFKYVIPYSSMLNLRTKFNELLNIDRDYNGYMVRSLYFDSIENNDYFDKLGGEINRKKIRLRIYDAKSNKVKLEIKSKYDIHQIKDSLVISIDDARKLINEDYEVLLSYDNDVATKIYTILKKGLYKPKVIIEYDRIAYTTTTTTRITFDFNIRSSNDIDKFFDDDINYNYLIDKKDVVLEVKFDRFLEPYISKILSSYDSRFQSISKYMMGRNINL